MPRSQPSLFARHDTFFGVCEALGQDFRINSNYPRLALGVGLLLSPVVALAVYFGLGMVIMVSRRIAPPRRTAAEPAGVMAAPLRGDNDAERIELVAAA